MNTDYRRIARDGLWDNNVVFAQMLALCPAIAVTGTASNGLGMGLATTAVMVVTGGVISMLRHWVDAAVRIPVFVLLIAAIVTLVDMAMNAWLHELHKVLGLFIPLIVTNCAILGRAESYASKNPVMASAADGLFMGLGFTAAMVLLGGVREVLGNGTLFTQAALLLGEPFKAIELTLIADYPGFLLMILPPGGFLALGFLLAGKRLLDRRLSRQRKPEPITVAPYEPA